MKYLLIFIYLFLTSCIMYTQEDAVKKVKTLYDPRPIYQSDDGYTFIIDSNIIIYVDEMTSDITRKTLHRIN